MKSSDYLQSLILQFINSEKPIITNNDTTMTDKTPNQVVEEIFNSTDVSIIENNAPLTQYQPIIVNKQNNFITALMDKFVTLHNIISLVEQAITLQHPEKLNNKKINDLSDLQIIKSFVKAAASLTQEQMVVVDLLCNYADNVEPTTFDAQPDYTQLTTVLNYFLQKSQDFVDDDVPHDPDDPDSEFYQNEYITQQILYDLDLKLIFGDSESESDKKIIFLVDAMLYDNELTKTNVIFNASTIPRFLNLKEYKNQKVHQVENNKNIVLSNTQFVHIYKKEDDEQTNKNEALKKISQVISRGHYVDIDSTIIFNDRSYAQEIDNYIKNNEIDEFESVKLTFDEQSD
jgi:hypothetical protein